MQDGFSEDNPIIVPCATESRIIGIVDPDDDATIWWRELHVGDGPVQVTAAPCARFACCPSCLAAVPLFASDYCSLQRGRRALVTTRMSWGYACSPHIVC